MIENETLRKSLAANAKDWVSQHRDAFKHVPKQIAFLEGLREKTKREIPHMPDEAWEDFEAKAKAAAEAEEPVEA